MPGTPAPDGLTIVSKKPVEFPALCAQCGEPTRKTLDVRIEIKSSAMRNLGMILFLFAGPLRELLLLGMEAGQGKKTAKIPFCKACQRPRTIATLKAFSLFLPGLALVVLFVSGVAEITSLSILFWGAIAALAFIRALFIIQATEKHTPVKITRDKAGYHYHFHSGIYRALAQNEGFHLADLTRALPHPAPPAIPAPEPQPTPWPPLSNK